MKTILLVLLFLTLGSCSYAATPVIFYSDLTSGPNTGGQNNKGVFVTIWGKNFGGSQAGSTVTIGGGNADNYPTWTDTMICFQLGANAVTGNIVVHTSGTSNGIAFTVKSGNIYFVNPTSGSNGLGTYASPFNYLYYAQSIEVAGDTIYVRASTIYDQINGRTGYHAILTDDRGGSSGSPVSWVAYPNETVILQADGGTSLKTNGGATDGDVVSYCIRSYAAWVNISKFTLQLTSTNANNINEVVQAATTGWRIVGNKVTALTYNYGEVETGGNNDAVLGNEIYNSGGSESGPVNTNHSIYWDAPGNPVEIGWNYMHNNVNLGWEISNYHNGPRIGTIHDNRIVATTAGDDKGILANGGAFDGGDTLSTTYTNNVKTYNNILVNTGQSSNGGVIQGTCGTGYIYNNTFYGSGTESKGMAQFTYGACGPGGGEAVWYLANNIFYGNNAGKYISDANGNDPANWSDFTILAKNNYFNEGNGPTQDTTAINGDPKFVSPAFSTLGDFHLQVSSPDVTVGFNTNSVVSTDFDGITRPNPPSVGAYEYSTSVAPSVSVDQWRGSFSGTFN